MKNQITMKPEINTFADCPYRVEEIYPSDSLGWLKTTTDPILLDWSTCTHPKHPSLCCECNLNEGKCPMGFPSLG